MMNTALHAFNARSAAQSGPDATRSALAGHDELVRHLGRVFDGLWLAPLAGPVMASPAGVMAGRQPLPPINVWEDDEAVMVEAELPGFKLSDLEITWEDRLLTIRGRRGDEADTTDGKGRYLRRERMVGEFSRSLRIAEEIDPDQVRATLNDGVLTVRLAKAPSVRPRTIAITTGT